MTETIHDSGERQAFATGAVRDTASGKPTLTLISPIYLYLLNRTYPLLLREVTAPATLNQVEQYIHLWRMDPHDVHWLCCASYELDRWMQAQPTATTVMVPRPEMPSRLFIERLNHWLELGAAKYAARNWEQGIHLERSLQSLLRHVGKLADGETDEDHAAAAACNLCFLVHTAVMIQTRHLPAELDDLPRYGTANWCVDYTPLTKEA